MRAEGKSELTTEELTLVINKLTQITRESTLDYAIRVGSLIVHYFYDGDTRVWRSKGPKTSSFRRLAERPDLPMSASALCRCVAIFELCERLGVVDRWRRMTVSHLRIVLRLDAEKQCRLLAAADAGCWSVQRLEEEVRPLASASLRPSGRRMKPVLFAQARALDRLVTSVTNAARQPLGSTGMSPTEQAVVVATLERSVRELTAARAGLVGDDWAARPLLVADSTAEEPPPDSVKRLNRAAV